jgi:hypothetical protein
MIFMKAIRYATSSLMLLALALPACFDSADNPDGDDKKGQVIYAFKNNKPFIVMDMFPELNRFKKLAPAAQEVFLMRRALATLHSDSMQKEQYKGSKQCVVRMLLVKSMNGYNQAEWGQAEEIALMEINRDKASSHLESTENLPENVLRACFASVKVHRDKIP